MANEDRWDVAIVGGGPAGYVAGIRAGQLGLKTVVVEADQLGGICLNWGCIPTKALLKNAEVFEHLRQAEFWGIKVQGVELDFPRVVERSREVAARLSKGVGYLLKKYRCDVIEGRARLTAPDRLQVALADGGTREVAADHVVLATGARPRPLPGIEFDGKTVLSYKEAMVLPEVPRSLLVVGAGAIGVEFAYMYHAFGAEVTLVEMMDHLLPIEDHEISKELARVFKKRKLAVHTSTRVDSLKRKKGGAEAVLQTPKGEQKVEAEKVLVAIGVQGNVEDLGLETVGVQTERGWIPVDRRTYRTEVPGVYAIGDVNGPPWLAHVGSAEGVVAVTRIAGKEHPGIDYGKIPGCTYCQPQVASIGLTEEAARERGIELKIGKFPFRASGKSLAIGETDGFVKLLFDAKYGGLIGAHIIGSEATEMIAELGLGLSLETTFQEILDTIHAHPTLAEAVAEATGVAYDEALAL
jgi:dihydrolipoamide dehydrogenase